MEPSNMKRSLSNGPQKYHGNGAHIWEPVVDEGNHHTMTERLRVPGGWLYRVGSGTPVYVPMPEVAGYVI